MFEPLQDFFSAQPYAIIDDATLLGEKGGRLFGNTEEEEFLRRGGTTFPAYRFANEGVMEWRSARDAKPSNTKSSSPWKRFVQVMRMPKEMGQRLLTIAAHAIPLIRVAFPSAVPRRSTLPAIASPRRSGPEQVRACAFHPYRAVLAVAVDEGVESRTARVCIYDVTDGILLGVLSRRELQRDVWTLGWKPYASDVLCVGCSGGVLLWSVFGSSGRAKALVGAHTSEAEWKRGSSGIHTAFRSHSIQKLSCSVFYRCQSSIPVTSVSFSSLDGRLLACGSWESARIHVLDISKGPSDPAVVVSALTPSIDGAVEEVLFAEDDTFVISVLRQRPTLAMTTLCADDFKSISVSTPAPIRHMERATGAGAHHFVLHMDGFDGVLIAHINPYVGVEVVATVSTALSYGVGGHVRTVACSKRRLWMVLETGHLLVCYYGHRAGRMTIIPIGVAAMESNKLVSFPGCASGSLLAAVDGDRIAFVPSFHV